MAISEIKLRDKRVFFIQDIGGKHFLTCRTLNNEPEINDEKGTYELNIQLFDKNDLVECIGEKTFTWPEKTLPEINVELKPSLIIILKGKLNVAQLPFQVPRRGPPKLPVGSHFTTPVGYKKSFNGKNERIDTTKNVTFAVQVLLQHPKSEEKWKSLVQKCENQTLEESLFCEPINKTEQTSFLKLLQDKLSKHEAQVFAVFNAIFTHRIINTAAFGDVVKQLIENKSYKLLLAFVRCPSTIIIDESFAPLLKYALSFKEEDTEELFIGMLYKGFTAAFLRRNFAEVLTANDAVKVLDLGVNLLDQKAGNDRLCDRIIELLLSLIDSHGDKLVWEEDCYASLKRAKDYIQSMTEMTSAFTKLLSKSKARSRLPELEAPAQTDFVVEKVKFCKKTII
uniref:Uncharacterized protein n=1 Tax=Panagrolaimus sp. ES5 TaxID=591445 RepID=A0AC34F6K5_9BILA